MSSFKKYMASQVLKVKVEESVNSQVVVLPELPEITSPEVQEEGQSFEVEADDEEAMLFDREYSEEVRILHFLGHVV